MFYGLDVHKEFIQVCAMDADGNVTRSYQVGADRESVTAFSKTLTSSDQVVLEATFHTWSLVGILEQSNVARVVVANPRQVKAIASARIKTDKIDARTLAHLLRTNLIPEVARPTDQDQRLRRLLSHRFLLTRQVTALKNAVRSVINAKLLKLSPKHLFSAPGLDWLWQQNWCDAELFLLKSNLELIRQNNEQLDQVDNQLREFAKASQDTQLLISIPGFNTVVATALISAIGDIGRFSSPDKLASYLGLVPKIRQSAGNCRHGSITKAGNRLARWLAVEAAQSMCTQTNSPLTATYHRVMKRKGHNVAVTAVARKLVVVCWHILTKREPYRYAPVARTRYKLRIATGTTKRASNGAIPNNLSAVYSEVGLPPLSPVKPAEAKASRANKALVTRSRNQRKMEKAEIQRE